MAFLGRFFSLIYNPQCFGCAGVPNTGKSEFVDALVLSLAQNYYWPICFASFEKLTHQHFSTLAEKVWGKPFKRREGYNEKDDGPIMSEREVCVQCSLPVAHNVPVCLQRDTVKVRVMCFQI